jgi:hypothetical protein
MRRSVAKHFFKQSARIAESLGTVKKNALIISHQAHENLLRGLHEWFEINLSEL